MKSFLRLSKYYAVFAECVFQPTTVTRICRLKRPLNIKEPACSAASLLTLHLILYVDYLSKAGSKYKQMHLVNESRCRMKETSNPFIASWKFLNVFLRLLALFEFKKRCVCRSIVTEIVEHWSLKKDYNCWYQCLLNDRKEGKTDKF